MQKNRLIKFISLFVVAVLIAIVIYIMIISRKDDLKFKEEISNDIKAIFDLSQSEKEYNYRYPALEATRIFNLRGITDDIKINSKIKYGFDTNKKIEFVDNLKDLDELSNDELARIYEERKSNINIVINRPIVLDHKLDLELLKNENADLETIKAQILEKIESDTDFNLKSALERVLEKYFKLQKYDKISIKFLNK